MGKEDRHHRSTSTYRGTWGRHTLQTDRRTRDRVRLFFWAVLTVVCLVAVMVARQQQEQGLQRKMEAAQERAVRFTQNVLADRLDAKRVSQPIGRSGYDELLTELKHGLFNDQRVVRVRVWRGDGMLVFTTDHPAQIGNVTADDAGVDLRPALRGDLTSVVVSESFARDDATTPEPTSLLSTFIPLRSTDKADVFGAVEIDNDYALMVDATEHPWKQVQIAFAILALICLVMAIVSLVWSHRPVVAETDGFGTEPSRGTRRGQGREEGVRGGGGGREAPRAGEGARGEDQDAFRAAGRAGEAPQPRRRVREQAGSGTGDAGGRSRRDGAAEGARVPARGAGAGRGIARHAAAIARDGDGGATPGDDRPVADGSAAGGRGAGGADDGRAAGDPGGAPGEADQRRRGGTGPA